MRELETSAKGYRALYENFLQRYMGSAQQEMFPISEARVISPASPPQSKSKPKTGLILQWLYWVGLHSAQGLDFSAILWIVFFVPLRSSKPRCNSPAYRWYRC